MQGVHPVIMMSLLMCTVLLIGIVFDQYVVKWIKNGLLGVCCICVCDLFIPVMWRVGINLLTVVVAALLGIPGVILMYLFNIMKYFN
ncbi:MAG: pro-sigmaK processing inhibitor BofA family protein [Niameybacter sp.]